MKLILASTSPRRKELLQQIGIEFKQMNIDINEDVSLSENPSDYVLRMAEEKASAGFKQLTSFEQQKMIVLAADTTVVCDGEVLAKPQSFIHSKAILNQLSGRQHTVMTAIACQSLDRNYQQLVTTEVTFRKLTDSEIEAYWQTGEPQDKAGSYGIQGLAAVFVEKIHGSYSNVVGLPLCETAELLEKFEIPLWQNK
jgi:septum formation protein